MLATVAVVLYEVQYVLFATLVGADAAFQAFVLGSALAILCSGNYMVELAERRLFAQARVIADLHRQVNDLFHRYLSPTSPTRCSPSPSGWRSAASRWRSLSCSPT